MLFHVMGKVEKGTEMREKIVKGILRERKMTESVSVHIYVRLSFCLLAYVHICLYVNLTVFEELLQNS